MYAESRVKPVRMMPSVAVGCLMVLSVLVECWPWEAEGKRDSTWLQGYK